MANLCIKTPSSAIQVLIFQLLVLGPRPTEHITVWEFNFNLIFVFVFAGEAAIPDAKFWNAISGRVAV